MKSNQIIKDLNKVIDFIQDDIEACKTNKDLEPFVYHMKALREIKYSLDLAKKYIIAAMPDKPEQTK